MSSYRVRFSGSDSYQQTGSTVELDDVTIEDAGYYYCTAEGPDGTRKTASIQVKVRETFWPTSTSEVTEDKIFFLLTSYHN